jgi:hypothetical protein
VSRFIPTLLRIALCFLPVAVGHSADALDDTIGMAAVSASDPVAVPNTATHAVATGAPRRTLDLRPPDLRSLHVQNLQQLVTSADSDEAEAVTLAAAPLLPEERPDTQPSHGGIASLLWAVRHPAQAWRVFLPSQLDAYDTNTENGGRASESATPETLTEQREISVNPSPTMLSPDTGGKCACRTQSGEAT